MTKRPFFEYVHEAMAIVWACPLSVEDYAAAGRSVRVPRPNCPGCGRQMAFEGSYRRAVRDGVDRLVVWVRRARCAGCVTEHALLPDFLAQRHRYRVETTAATVTSTALSLAAPAGVPVSTARAWRRSFRGRQTELTAGMTAAAVMMGDLAPRLPVDRGGTAVALAAIAAAWVAAGRRHGRGIPSLWRFANVMVGGTLWSTRVQLAWAAGRAGHGPRAPAGTRPAPYECGPGGGGFRPVACDRVVSLPTFDLRQTLLNASASTAPAARRPTRVARFGFIAPGGATRPRQSLAAVSEYRPAQLRRRGLVHWLRNRRSECSHSLVARCSG